MEGCTKMCYDRSIKVKTNKIKTSCYWPLVLCKFNICHVYLFILVVISQAVASNDEYGDPLHLAHVLPRISSILLTRALSVFCDLCIPRCEVSLDLLCKKRGCGF